MIILILIFKKLYRSFINKTFLQIKSIALVITTNAYMFLRNFFIIFVKKFDIKKFIKMRFMPSFKNLNFNFLSLIIRTELFFSIITEI